MAKEKLIYIETVCGKKGARIKNDGFGLELYTMRNGYQWNGSGVDMEIMDMIIECIEKYKKGEDNE